MILDFLAFPYNVKLGKAVNVPYSGIPYDAVKT